MNRSVDSQLVRRLQAGDETAVQELAERFGPRIHQLALRHMGNPADAEEVTQDVLMKVYRKIGAFRGDSALSSWIYRITFNTAMSRLRSGKAARAAEVEQTIEAAGVFLAIGHTPNTAFLDGQLELTPNLSNVGLTSAQT